MSKPAVALSPKGLAFTHAPIRPRASFDERILGFGNRQNFLPAFERAARHTALQKTFRILLEAKLAADAMYGRLRDGVRRRLKLATR